MANNVSSQEITSSDVDSSERDTAPSHYILNIESFSSFTKMLLEGGIQYYESKIFEASGYKWKFSVYPNGDAKRNSTGHISVFLRIEGTDAFPLGWEIYTDLKFFIFDQMRDKYSIFQGRANRFHRLKPEWGIAKLVPRDVFDDAANGYLVSDECVFGVEVFVLHSKFTRQHLKPSVKVDKTFTWKEAGTQPLGDSESYVENLSLFFMLADPQFARAGLLVHFTLCIRNQTFSSRREKQTCRCFVLGSLSWGWTEFMPLTDLLDSDKGFLVNDCIVIEAHIKSVSTINN